MRSAEFGPTDVPPLLRPLRVHSPECWAGQPGYSDCGLLVRGIGLASLAVTGRHAADCSSAGGRCRDAQKPADADRTTSNRRTCCCSPPADNTSGTITIARCGENRGSFYSPPRFSSWGSSALRLAPPDPRPPGAALPAGVVLGRTAHRSRCAGRRRGRGAGRRDRRRPGRRQATVVWAVGALAVALALVASAGRRWIGRRQAPQAPLSFPHIPTAVPPFCHSCSLLFGDASSYSITVPLTRTITTAGSHAGNNSASY